MNIHFELN
jgi:hypothetical protein